jgi:hypothetical protein
MVCPRSGSRSIPTWTIRQPTSPRWCTSPTTGGQAGVWSHLDADADPDPRWGLTGATFAGTECDINGARCTYEQLLDCLDDGAPDAVILTVQVGKGRDFAFSGAVDSLIINDQKFDFEPFGVITTTIP